MELLECYYTSNPRARGYMGRMWDQWMLRNPQSRQTKKQLLAQCSNIRNRKLLSQLEIDEILQQCYGKGEPGRQVSGGISPSPPQFEIGYQAPRDIESLNTRAADLRRKIVTQMETWSLRQIPKLSCQVPSEDLLEDVNAAIRTIPTGNITETNKLIYSTATVILEMLGYKINTGHDKQYPPW